MNTEEQILQGCLAGDRQAQRTLYERFKNQMFVQCLRYADSREEAEDILHEGFVKVFRDLHQYSGQGPLGAWIRKVMVNTALQQLRKNQRLIPTTQIEHVPDTGDDDPVIQAFEGNNARELIRLLQSLPAGYRTVLNLYVLEGYSHKEIAEQLQINVSTSKSQLLRAKEMLRKKLEKTLNT
ncbi:MAG: RNA polymerase sigma factor [Bacteroidetes bacterium]|nr:MAG: RNA polymerase sigma factor [Bacteroidota bacterium]